MWSFGCIMYELLMYFKYSSTPDELFIEQFSDERYLFPGNSCYPLSKYKKKNEKGESVALREEEKIGSKD